MDNIDEFKKIIDASNNIVFFGGAGVSTESGIPDFRSKDGLYNQRYKYPPEVILSHTFFMNETKEFYIFYRDKLNALKYEPNITHIKLVELEKAGKLKSIVTQNIDGLHQKAGSKNVYELHGSVLRNYCMKCHKFYDDKYIFNSKDIPRCSCNGIIKPDVVLYEEELKRDVLDNILNDTSISSESLEEYLSLKLREGINYDHLLKKLASEGNAYANFEMGTNEYYGYFKGYPRYDEAYKYFKEAALLDHAPSN